MTAAAYHVACQSDGQQHVWQTPVMSMQALHVWHVLGSAQGVELTRAVNIRRRGWLYSEGQISAHVPCDVACGVQDIMPCGQKGHSLV